MVSLEEEILELKVQVSVSDCSVAERMGLAVRLSMERSSASVGALGSLRFEVPETASVKAVLTMSVVSGSVTVRVPEVVRVELVSEMDAVCESPVPTLITGASFTAATLMLKVEVSLVPEPSVTV